MKYEKFITMALRSLKTCKSSKNFWAEIQIMSGVEGRYNRQPNKKVI